jgi:hypothetical protein
MEPKQLPAPQCSFCGKDPQEQGWPLTLRQADLILRKRMKKLFIVVLLLSVMRCYGQHTRASREEISNNLSVGSASNVYNALSCSTSTPASWCSGSDIGAWVNAAAATCPGVRGQCVIEISPTGQMTITTPIVFVGHETLRCSAANVIDNTAGHDSYAKLYYNGASTAITMNSNAGRLIGCDILLGSSVAVGIQVADYSNWISDVGIRGGGTSTQLVHMGSASIPSEDNHINNSRFSDFIGTAVACDHANDNWFTNLTMYGKYPVSSTGINFLIDSACTGTQMDNVAGGSTGKNFMKVQYTMGGPYPTYLFSRDTQCDIASGDCYLFDSSLGSALIDYTFDDCWAAGASGRGFHISGGSNIRLSGCIIRTNGLDGILIDSGAFVSNGVYIEHNLISANNQSNTASTNGITISGHPVAVSVIGNFIQNAPEPGGRQAYAISSSSDVEGLIFAENFCSNLVTGCANLSAVTSTKLTYFGNLNLVSGANTQAGYMPTTSLFGITQPASNTFAGKCTMSSGTTCTFSVTQTYTNYISFASIDQASSPPASAISAKCAISGTAVTITAGASNSLTWDCVLIGNPN